MEKINANAMGISFGLVAAAIYIVCLVFVAAVPLETVVRVSNSFMHGIDISSIASKDVGFADSLLGLAITVLGVTAIGYLFAGAYNMFDEKLR